MVSLADGAWSEPLRLPTCSPYRRDVIVGYVIVVGAALVCGLHHRLRLRRCSVWSRCGRPRSAAGHWSRGLTLWGRYRRVWPSGSNMALTEAYLGLGSNLGDRVANLQMGAALLADRAGEIEVSSVYRTIPVGFSSQPEYLNAVGRIRTRLSPFDLMHAIRIIERDQGRVRTVINGPRTLDVDILLFGSTELHSPPVTVPHPRLAERAFALEPLAELAPLLRHPTLGLTMRELLERMHAAPRRVVLYSRRWGQSVTP